MTLRPGTSADAEACGRICYEAFKAVDDQHNFPLDFPTPDVGVGLIYTLFANPDVYAVVAELDGRIVGSCFLTEDAIVAGLGPITVDPTVQNRSVGRRLMEHALTRVWEQGFAGVRLVQESFHNRSLALYAKLGFDVREMLSVMQGPAIHEAIPGHEVRPAAEGDLEACAALSQAVIGFDRSRELLGAIQRGTATVVEHAGRISGYATSVGFGGHATAETNEDLKALIGAAPAFPGTGFLLPTRNGEVLRWCLARGLRVVQPMTLMSRGLYTEPAGAVLPSILY